MISQRNNYEKIINQGEKTLNIVNIDPINKGPYILETLKVDKNNNKSDALNDIYKVLRPGEGSINRNSRGNI